MSNGLDRCTLPSVGTKKAAGELPSFIKGRAVAEHLADLNLVPEPDARGGWQSKETGKAPDPTRRAGRFLDNMGRRGLLPRSAPNGYPAWLLHAAAEICDQRQAGLSFADIELPPEFDTVRLLSDLGLAVSHCSKLFTGPAALKPLIVAIRDGASEWPGVTEATIFWIDSTVLTAAVRVAELPAWSFLEESRGLRRKVLEKHEAVMRRKGWLVPPAARPT